MKKYFVKYFANFKNEIQDLTDKERLEVVSNIVYFAEQYKYKDGFDNRRIMSWMYLTNGEGENGETLSQLRNHQCPSAKFLVMPID